ncbi:MAG: lipopolysaccharide kinase InaA family protein, partial [Planctomycetaceae bacterium]
VEAFCRRAARRAYRKGDRKWSRGNRRLIIADTPACQCRGVVELGREQLTRLRDEVLNNPRLTGGGPATGLPPVVLEAIVEHPRRAWEIGHAFLRRGIHTPRPLWFVEATDGSASVLVTDGVPGAVSLSMAAARAPSNSDAKEAGLGRDVEHAHGGLVTESLLRQAAGNLGVQLRRMHEHGFDHRRLTAETVLVRPHDGHVWLTDLEHAVPLRWRQQARIVTALARLEHSLPNDPALGRTHRLRFLLRYLGHQRRREWKSLWLAVSRRDEGRSQDRLSSKFHHGDAETRRNA